MNELEIWDYRYKNNLTPWESGQPYPELIRLFNHYIPAPTSVLDIGCGLGTQSRWLAENRYHVTGIDMSAEAIKQARMLSEQAGHSINFLELNFLNPSIVLPSFAAVLDCAVLQILKTENLKALFIKNIANVLKPGGHWVNISCSSDHAEEIEAKTGVKAPPRLAVKELIDLTEPWFEVIDMRKCDFPIDRGKEGKAIYVGHGCLFKKRK